MELTETQRHELGQIALSLFERDSPDRSEKGREAIEARKRKREKLRQLSAAWVALESETQQDIVAHLLRMWDEYDHDKPLPDVALVADELIAVMTGPANRREDHPGLGSAVRYLWTVWTTDRPGRIPIDLIAVQAIAKELVPLFALDQNDAENRIIDILRAWDKGKAGVEAMPGRGSGKRWDKQGLRVE